MAKKKKYKSKDMPLQGIIVRAMEGVSKVANITLPELEKNCYIIKPKDILGSNRIDILEDSFPLLSSSTINYVGQPLLLVLAPTFQKAEKIKDQIIIKYLEIETAKKLAEPKIIKYSFGEIEEQEDIQEFSSSMTFSKRASNREKSTRIIVEKTDDLIEVYSPTQWPFFIKECIATTCAINKKKIVVHREENYSPKDEKLIYPAVLASLGALGVLITGQSVEIHSNFQTFKPEIEITRTTKVTNDKKTLSEEIFVKIDQGAYPLFSKEITRQMLAGLMPLYHVDALDVTFEISSSYNPPAHFFGGLGYVDAVASSQIHSSKLGKHLGFTPFLWREFNLSESDNLSSILKTTNISIQKQLLEELEGKSFFNRKYAAYKVNQNLKNKLSTFSPYARGIGLSIAPGISGFSSEFNDLPRQPIKLTLDVGGKVIFNTSFIHSGKSAEIWKSIISRELDVPIEGISFVEDGEDLIDSGPNVLANNSWNMSNLIKKACDQITEKRFIQGLPIEVIAELEKPKAKSPLFTSTTWVATVVELRINPITLEPTVFNINGYCSVGTLANEKAYIAKLKQSIISILIEHGAKLASGEEFNINLEIYHSSTILTDSINGGLKGAILAAFDTALEMALNEEINILPTSSENILEAIKDQI